MFVCAGTYELAITTCALPKQRRKMEEKWFHGELDLAGV
jgi:hypothetical protein